MTEEIRNKFGQLIQVGDVVGWGHRDGNMSAQQVGIVLSFKPYTGGYWDPVEREHKERDQYKVRCYWVSGHGYRNEYASSTEASDVFVLDESTFDDSVRRRLVLARAAQLP